MTSSHHKLKRVDFNAKSRNLRVFMNIGERTKITPQMIDDLLKFKEVKCGAKFVYLLDINDRLWCWGSNIDGQLLFDNYYKT